MSVPEFSVKNHVLVNMLMLAILVGGAIIGLTLVREMFPESRPNKIMISAMYPGVQPADVEKAVTIKIEDAVHDVEGVEKVESTVAESLSMTALTLFNDVDDVHEVLQEVENEVDAIPSLPDDLERVTIQALEPMLPVISVAVFGEGEEADLKRAADRIRDDLVLLPGISKVEISGVRDDEISVEIRPDRLLEYDVTFQEVASAIRVGNLDISGGTLKGDRVTTTVRTQGEETRGRDLEDIIVRSQPDGKKVYLADVAAVHDEFVDSDLESYFNSKPAAYCTVFKTPAQDAIQIATLVKAYVAGKKNEPFDAYGFQAAYEQPWYSKPFALAGASFAWGAARFGGRPDPAVHYQASLGTPFNHGFEVALHTDLARFVEGRLDLLRRNGQAGLILVLISLNLFLNWRVAFWAAIGLPVSFLGSFIVRWAGGSTINLLTMFGLIIVLGIIVDDAIVIGENIYRHVEEGMPPMRAAVVGAEEVMWPVTVAILTTIAAFAPLLFVKGQIGDFMGQLPIVVLSALSVSLIEALIILPAHLSGLPAKKKKKAESFAHAEKHGIAAWHERFVRARERLFRATLLNYYERFLRFALAWRYVTLCVAIATLLLSLGLWQGGMVESVFVQDMDTETVICALEMPVGTTADNTRARLQALSDAAVELPEVANVQMFVARQYDFRGEGAVGNSDQSHLGQLVVELQPADERERLEQRSSEELVAVLRKASADLPGVNSVTWDAFSGGPGGQDIHIEVTGRDFEEIVAVANKLKEELRGYEGVFDLDDNYDRGQHEVRLKLLEAARPTGITVDVLGQHVRSAMYGYEARRITRNREDVRIMVRYPESFRKSVYNLESMWIPATPSIGERGWVPLSEVAELTEDEGYTTIHRSHQQRSVAVFGAIDQEITETLPVLNRVRETFENEFRPEHPGVRLEFLGSYEEMTKAFSSLQLGAAIALLMIYTLLAGLFRSYVQPIVVMAAIPFGVEGAIVGHWITDNPLTILSWIGMVALTGIVVNDALVLVDFINARVRRGMSELEASIEGAKLRLRAILLTTLTTVAGLTPIMFEQSFQARFLIPMAVTLTFGLAFATALTLIIVPTLNLIFFDIRALAGRLVGRQRRESVIRDEESATDLAPAAS